MKRPLAYLRRTDRDGYGVHLIDAEGALGRRVGWLLRVKSAISPGHFWRFVSVPDQRWHPTGLAEDRLDDLKYLVERSYYNFLLAALRPDKTKEPDDVSE